MEKKTVRLILSRRTTRRFRPDPIPRDVLTRAVDAGRLAPSAANLQPLEFVVVDDPAVRAEIFPALRWAAYIAPAGNPGPGEEPAAYVVVLNDPAVREKGYEYDVGAAVENVILAAWEEKVASCWMISIDRDRIGRALGVPAGKRIDCVIAMGYPAESPTTEVMADSPKYWKDAEGRLHVPKRSLEAVLSINRYGGK